MTINLYALRRELMASEGVRSKPYRDTVGKLTIGVGRNLDDVGLDEDEIDLLLSNDICRTIRSLDRTLPWWRKIPAEPRRRAVVEMAFNLGVRGLLGFKKMLAALMASDWPEAARQALDSKWARQVGGRAQRIAKTLETGE